MKNDIDTALAFALIGALDDVYHITERDLKRAVNAIKSALSVKDYAIMPRTPTEAMKAAAESVATAKYPANTWTPMFDAALLPENQQPTKGEEK